MQKTTPDRGGKATRKVLLDEGKEKSKWEVLKRMVTQSLV